MPLCSTKIYALVILFAIHGITHGVSLSNDKSAQDIACQRNPSLPYCGNRERRESDRDELACRELRNDYRETCTRDKAAASKDEFCAAYENVCFRIPKGEPDQVVVTVTTGPPSGGNASRESDVTTEAVSNSNSNRSEHSKKDYSEFCREYKQRFLYVCPDPFRFGQRAAVFCPIYSERCQVPVPDKPITPTDRPRVNPISEAIANRQKMCTQFRGFAISYCNNPFALQQASIREGCTKYRRFCTREQRRGGRQ